jgi:tetraacyldisaccharide 4'-kinase
MMMYFRGYAENITREKMAGISSFFSPLYGTLQRARVFLYRKGFLKTERVESRVISIGNITAGGTGKTPAVMAIAQMAKGKGFKVAILTRGYRGKAKGIKPVSDGSKILLDCKDAGDEPYLMAKKLSGIPIIKGKNRYLSAKFSIERFGSDLFILDDGFQHLKLHRDLNILLIDATDPFGNGHVLPRGILREPLIAIRRADIIVITKADLSQKIKETVETIRKYNTAAPVFFGHYKPVDLIDMKGNTISIDNIRDSSLFLFSGLASHSSFRLLLEREGAKVSGELTYPDHFDYSKKDLDEIERKAGSLGTDMVVTTEKDIVKIPYLGKKTQIWALRIEFIIEDGERWESLLFSKKQSGGGNN